MTTINTKHRLNKMKRNKQRSKFTTMKLGSDIIKTLTKMDLNHDMKPKSKASKKPKTSKPRVNTSKPRVKVSKKTPKKPKVSNKTKTSKRTLKKTLKKTSKRTPKKTFKKTLLKRKIEYHYPPHIGYNSTPIIG